MSSSTGVGIVTDEHVTGVDLVEVVAPQYLLDQPHQRTEVDRDVLGLRQRSTLGVEDDRRAIAALFDVGRIGCADQGRTHLFDERSERGPDDFDGDRIERALES